MDGQRSGPTPRSISPTTAFEGDESAIEPGGGCQLSHQPRGVESGAENARADARRLGLAWWSMAGVLLLARFLLPHAVPAVEAYAWWDSLRWLAEIWVVIGVVTLAVHRAKLNVLLTRPLQVAVLLLLGGTMVAHLAPILPDLYPLANWSMYTTSASEVRYTEFLLLSEDEVVGEVPFDQVVPAMPVRAFVDLLDQWVARHEAGDPAAGQVIADTMQTFIRALGDPRVDGVEVRSCIVQEPTGPDSSRCERVLIVDR